MDSAGEEALLISLAHFTGLHELVVDGFGHGEEEDRKALDVLHAFLRTWNPKTPSRSLALCFTPSYTFGVDIGGNECGYTRKAFLDLVRAVALVIEDACSSKRTRFPLVQVSRYLTLNSFPCNSGSPRHLSPSVDRWYAGQ